MINIKDPKILIRPLLDGGLQVCYVKEIRDKDTFIGPYMTIKADGTLLGVHINGLFHTFEDGRMRNYILQKQV